MKVLQNENGFTLIEVLIAGVILAIGIFTLQAMQVTAIKGNSHANRITTSSTWGTDQIEQIYALPYRDTSLTCAADLMCDTDGDGTNQDPDLDGIDTEGLDTSFGLNDTGAAADATINTADGIHTIYINVAEDHPIPNNKTIRVIVDSLQFGQNRRVVYNYIKADII